MPYPPSLPLTATLNKMVDGRYTRVRTKDFSHRAYHQLWKNNMNVGITTDQELAGEQLRAIAPLVHLARQVFIAINVRPTDAAIGGTEAAATKKSLALAKATLMLEYRLKQVVAGEDCRPKSISNGQSNKGGNVSSGISAHRRIAPK